MSQTELVFIPSSGMGHLVSTVDLTKRVVRANPNISILVIIYYMTDEPTQTRSYIEFISRDADIDRVTFITLPRLTNPPDPSSPTFFGTVIQLQIPLVKEAIAARGMKPAAFVLDFANMFMMEVANDLNVPSYIYFICGANFLNTIFQFQELADELGFDGVSDLVGCPDTELDLRGFSNRVPARVLPGALLDKESGMPSAMIQLAKKFRETKGILVNSFMELESLTIKALLEQEKIPTVYPVGPIVVLEGRDDDSRKVDEEVIMRWLDEQPESSVVFLCFGSMGCFDAEQVKEIANGLDRSGHRFLWTLRMTSEDETFEDALPEGFLDRMAHRGKIISWAPQIAVLAHKAVGGFVSHCGWNSILESMWFGVPIATWPLHSEQQLNAFTLVKELGLAVEISLDYRSDSKKGKGKFLVSAEEVENGVKKLMNMDEEMKVKLRVMSDKGRKASQSDGGSSYKCLTSFIAEITQNANL